MSATLNAEELPEGWDRSPSRGDEIGIRHRNDRLAVRAVRVAGVDEWEIELEDRASNRYTTVRPVGRVEKRRTAVEALVSFAETVNELVDANETTSDDVVRAVGRIENAPN